MSKSVNLISKSSDPLNEVHVAAMNTSLNNAVVEFLAREDRSSNPDGYFDNGGRFYPSDKEHCACCDGIRTPSRSYPYSLMVHCRSAEHVAHLFDVDSKTLRRAIKLHRSGKSFDDLQQVAEPLGIAAKFSSSD